MLEDFSSNDKRHVLLPLVHDIAQLAVCFFDIAYKFITKETVSTRSAFWYQGNPAMIRSENAVKFKLVSFGFQSPVVKCSWKLALIHTKLSLEGRLFMVDLDHRNLPAEQSKPLPSSGPLRMSFSRPYDSLEKTCVTAWAQKSEMLPSEARRQLILQN
ncbi:hypothetical protein Tco_0705186 [Tanacetum coccineum]|uniref:Uncharacterized protein n=1 Tax=Tanacetum coccineum TaxID=301880 RepID=A0ABQ4Y3V3_9ASTR